MTMTSVLHSCAGALLVTVLLLLPVPRPCQVIPVMDRHSLQRHLCEEERPQQQVASGMVLKLVSSEHILNVSGFCLIANSYNITITSASTDQATIVCPVSHAGTPTTGLAFVNITMLNVINVKMSGCGAALHSLSHQFNVSRPYFHHTSAASIAVVDCYNVTISQVSVAGYFGYAILAVNVFGHSVVSGVSITSFTRSGQLTPTTVSAGSGLMVYYHDEAKSGNTITSFHIANSSFVGNYYMTDDARCLSDMFSLHSKLIPSTPMPYAAGLSVVYNLVGQILSVTVSNCNISRNIGTLAGGMLVLYLDTISDVTTTVNENTVITCNTAVNRCRGVGLSVITFFSPQYVHNYTSPTNQNHHWIAFRAVDSSISFHLGLDPSRGSTHHSIQNSGVVYLLSSRSDTIKVHVIFQKVKFHHSTSLDTGTCIYGHTMLTVDNGRPSLIVLLSDVNVIGNVHDLIQTNQATGAIFTFIDIASVHVTSSTSNPSLFQGNDGSVIEAYNTDVHLSGHLLFQNNKASRGAALKLLGGSHIFLLDNLTALFKGNYAEEFGGALFRSVEKTDDNILCTFQLVSETLSQVTSQGPRLIFEDNDALLAGNSIYATLLYDCQQIQLDIRPQQMPQLYDIIFRFENNSHGVSSPPSRIIPCIGMSPQLDSSNHLLVTLPAFPGQELTLNLSAVDAANHTVFSQVQLAFYRRHDQYKLFPVDWWLSPGQDLQILSHRAPCTPITATIHTKHVQCNDSSVGYCIRLLYLSFPGGPPSFWAKVTLKPCPPGFQLNSNGLCDCCDQIKVMNRNYGLAYFCEIQNATIHFPNTESWIGCMDYGKEHCTLGIARSCLHGFCDLYQNQWISPSSNKCVHPRGGALCGHCPVGLSVVFGSNYCHKCSHWWLFTTAGYLAAGLLLVLLLFSLKLTISTGTLNGVIFFANLANTGILDLLSLEKHQLSWVGFNRIFLSLLNLGLGFSLCFYNGMTEIVKSWLLLVFPVYLLLLVVMVVVVSHYSSRVSRYVYSSAVPVLVTVVHLSFSRLLMTLVDIFAPADIHTNGTIVWVWMRNGSVRYTDPQHVALMVVSSSITAVFVLPYLILLFGARLWIKSRLVSMYLKPVIDAAFGPYKVNKQHWFGLRLCLLMQQLAVYAYFRGYQYYLLYSVNGPILIVFAILHTNARPFKSKAVNLLDGLIMTVFCLLYACTWYPLITNQFEVTTIITSSLISVIFCVFTTIITYHVLLVCGCLESASTLVGRVVQHLPPFAATPSPTHRPLGGDDDCSQLREPLLSYGTC